MVNDLQQHLHQWNITEQEKHFLIRDAIIRFHTGRV